MPKIEYVGQSNFREITANDWASVEVENQTSVVWSNTKAFTRKGVNKIQEVSEAAAAFLLENEKGDWKLIKEEPADSTPPPPPPATRRVKDAPQA